MLRNEVVPYYEALADYSSFPLPKLERQEDLLRMLRPYRIEVSRLTHQGEAFIAVSGESPLDDEHGVEIVVHKDMLAAVGGLRDTGIEYKLSTYIGEPVTELESWKSEDDQWDDAPYAPDDKYGVVKPARADANFDLFLDYLFRGDLANVQHMFNQYNLDPNTYNYEFDRTYYSQALEVNQPAIINYLASIGGRNA